jgi:hypothetical protein
MGLRGTKTRYLNPHRIQVPSIRITFSGCNRIANVLRIAAQQRYAGRRSVRRVGWMFGSRCMARL